MQPAEQPPGGSSILADVNRLESVLKGRRIEYRPFTSLAAISPSPVAVTDDQGRYLFVNTAFFSLFAYTLGDLSVRRDWYEPVPQKRASMMLEASMVKSAFEDTGIGDVRQECLKVTCNDGSIRYAIARSLMLDEGRQCTTYEDVTDRIEKAEDASEITERRLREMIRSLQADIDAKVSERALALENANQALQAEIAARIDIEEKLKVAMNEYARSNAELEQFAYVASHDLQEPLRAIIAYAQLLSRRYAGRLDSDADDFIHFIVDGGTRMNDLICDLLEYSRVTTENFSPSPVACESVYDDVCANLNTAIGESGAVITHDPLPEVMADYPQIMRIFQNLISNAIKFCGDRRPEIHISVQIRHGDYLFSVRDNGIGIKSESCDRIFEAFQRLHTRSERQGTGMGLAICKRIIERHGGRIWVESEPGRGSTFFFTLPIPVHP
jgi:signal transduction histidine kinase